MSSKPHSRYRIWLEQANYDISIANISLTSGYYEWACYQSVQSVEKALKGVLVHSGWSPPMTHKLGVLVGLCNRANKVFSNVKLNFRQLEAYTFISRYPFVYPHQGNKTPHEIIQKIDAENCVNIATELYKKVSDFLSQQSEYPGEIINPDDYYFTTEEVKERIERIKESIVKSDKLNLYKIILFGSFARENTRPRTSTMDIIVIADTELSFIERIQYVREITRGGEPIVEPLIYTPQEFDFLLNEEGEGFIESAISEGKLLWEKGKQN